MRASRDSALDLTPLGHPIWWAALIVLLVNDHFLKGWGEAPGWLTGKLSDFAFLVVAPSLLAAFLPRGWRWRRATALLSVTGLFAAAKLSPAVSDALVAAVAALFNVRWRLWPDPTDLLALTVLPATWWLIGRSHQPGGAPILKPAGATRLALERAGMVLGAFACLATSPVPSYEHHPFFVNRAAQSTEVTFTWLLRRIDCQQDLAELAAKLNPSDLDDPHSVTLASGQVAPLDAPPKPGAEIAGHCSNEPRSWMCVGILVEAKGGPAVLAVAEGRWNETESTGPLISCSDPPKPVSLCQSELDPANDPGPDALWLSQVDDKMAFGAGAKVRFIEISRADIDARPSDPDGCRTLRDDFRAEVAEAKTCSTDSECRLRPSLEIPGDDTCWVYVNQSISTERYTSWEARWRGNCLTSAPDRCAAGLQPAACHSGICEMICPGVNLEGCPESCKTSEFFGTGCPGFPGCLDETGLLLCSCKTGEFACESLSLPPGCPIPCVPSDQ